MEKYCLVAYERIMNDRTKKLFTFEELQFVDGKWWASPILEFDYSVNDDEAKAKLLKMYGSEIPSSDYIIEIRKS